MTINESAQGVVEEFWMFDDWMDKYAYLIELGKDLPVIDSQFKTNNHLISGCQSRVWLHAEEQEGQIVFTADSDAVITKGIVSLLIRILSNHTPQEILEADFSFLESIGLQEHLSPTRANGLASMIKQIQLYARAFQLKSNQL
ncbi:MAG: Fe-S metabolism protein SufE [Bacteroidetes bacterium HGW-Bacteroidetes-16]|jgi:cysteine desulfuration protein SufE|nr:MAG: Fe-S metabolism protein SufE [Bacteroidetes bacterium HGW-Bacteroidetes-16]